jgi:hypothetical protein
MEGPAKLAWGEGLHLLQSRPIQGLGDKRIKAQETVGHEGRHGCSAQPMPWVLHGLSLGA